MRRGLISRAKTELPDAALDARLERVRAAMSEARRDALLVYTNNTRPAGVSWLTGFVPYWSEALLIVPRQADPVLVVALSYRVKSWIERTSRVAEVIHTPRIGLEAARIIGAAKPDAAVGIVDFDGLSAGIADDLAQGGPRLVLSDASALFARVRAKADPTDVALAHKAASIAHRALCAVPRRETRVGEIIAAVEAEARRAGAEEIYIAAAPDLEDDQRLIRVEGDAVVGAWFALRATVAYKGSWIRLVRTLCHDRAAVRSWEQAAERFAQAVAHLPSGRAFAGFSSWLVEGCLMAQPLEPLVGSRITEARALAPGALVSVQASIVIDGRPMLLGAPALIGERGEAASLLADPLFD